MNETYANALKKIEACKINQPVAYCPIPGPIGPTGPQGLVGPPGINGINGDSAYQVAVNNGYIGTEEQWLASLIGPTGPTGPEPISAFGGIFEEMAPSITLVSGVEQQMPFSDFTDMENVTLGSNSLIVLQTGVYKLDYYLYFWTAIDTFSIQATARRNSISLVSTELADILSNTDTKTLSSSTIVPLNSGDVIDLIIYSAEGGEVMFGPGLSATLLLTKIG